MIGKLIVHGEDRQEALARAQRALFEYVIRGIDTTIGFARFLLNRRDVIAGNYHTKYVEQLLENGLPAFEEEELSGM